MVEKIPLTAYAVKDLASAKALYAKLLGVAPYADSPYYVGFRIGDHEIGLVPNARHTGALVYWQVADIRNSLAAMLDAGATLESDVKDVGGGKLIALIRDADGNLIGISQ